MSDDVKTIVFPEANNGNIAEILSANKNDMWNNPIWALVFLSVLGNGGLYGNGRNAGQINSDFIATQLGQAIAGNGNAISNLATQLNCTEGQIQNSLNTMMSGINNLANSSNMNAQSIINAINSGNQNVASQLCECCCSMKQLITQTNYENQIATLNQTNLLGSKIDGNTLAISNAIAAQTNMINDKFCELEKRELNSKIDALREANSTLTNQISNYTQTANLQAYINNALAPINNVLVNNANELASLKCKLPETITVPYSNAVAVPTCVAANYGLGLFGGNSLWS